MTIRTRHAPWALAGGTALALLASGVVASTPANADRHYDAPYEVIRRAAYPDRANDVAKGPGGVTYTQSLDGSSIDAYRNRGSGQELVRSITGPRTTLKRPGSLATSRSGELYVSDGAAVNVFAAGADGDTAPIRRIAGPRTGLPAQISDIAVGSAGALYVADKSSVRVYAAGARGNVRPLRRLKIGSGTAARIAVGRTGRVYVTDSWEPTIKVYRPGASGRAKPVRVIGGKQTSLEQVSALGVDRRGNLYAAQVGDEAPYGVLMFTPGQRGNVRPARTFASHSLEGINSLHAGRRGALTVHLGKDIRSYLPIVGAPSAVRALRVKGAKSAKRRAVTWKRPRTDRGRPIRSYRVVVKRGKRTLVSKHVKGTRTTIRRAKLRPGVNRVIVSARNAKKKGYGPPRVVRFRVRK